MSIPYFIHKDDADRYDALEKERKALEAQERLLMDIEYSKYTEKEWSNYPSEGLSGWRLADLWVNAQMTPYREALNIKYDYLSIRHKSSFDKMTGREYGEYYIYFRGWRCDDDFGVAMMGVAKIGIAKCKKVLGDE